MLLLSEHFEQIQSFDDNDNDSGLGGDSPPPTPGVHWDEAEVGEAAQPQGRELGQDHLCGSAPLASAPATAETDGDSGLGGDSPPPSPGVNWDEAEAGEAAQPQGRELGRDHLCRGPPLDAAPAAAAAGSGGRGRERLQLAPLRRHHPRRLQVNLRDLHFILIRRFGILAAPATAMHNRGMLGPELMFAKRDRRTTQAGLGRLV